MTKAERDELAKLVRRREKLAKADVDRVAAERLAEFEQQVASNYRVGDDEVWRQAHTAVASLVAEANLRVAERCRELEIPEEFAPSISAYWHSRGENAARDRVVELRRVAKTRLDVEARTAKTAIERRSLEVQTELVAGGLASAEAQAFLASMPTAEALMPAITVAEIEQANPASPRRELRALR